jgi:hypothetical protein
VALLHVTDDAEALYHFWNTQEGNVPLQELASVAPGTHVETVVLFSMCQPDTKGNCQVWGNASVKTERGEVLSEGARIALWVDRPAPPPGTLGISEHGVGLVTDLSAGAYFFQLEVEDTVGKRTVTLARELRVEAGE